MSILLMCEIEKTCEYIFKVDECFSFSDCTTSGDAIIQITLITKFSDDVAVIDCAVYVKTVDKVRMLQFLEDFDLDI